MIEEILKQYSTQKEGLSGAEANARLDKYGLNKLKEQKKDSPLKLFLSQFLDVLIFMLIIAAIASYMIGNHLDAIVILVVVIINSIIGFVQEYRAENAMEKLKSLVHTDAHVKRDNNLKRIPSEKLVPGDIVILEEGDKVPADLILIETYDLGVDESSLTGESTLVKKDTKYENIEDFSNKIKDIQKYSKDEDIQSKLVSMNSNVIFGKGTGVVIATGMETTIGRIATMIQEDQEETPLTIKVGQLGKKIGILSIIICIFVFFIDFFQAMDILESFMTAVSLAVAKAAAIAELNNLATVSVIYPVATEAVAAINAVEATGTGLAELNAAIEAVDAIVAKSFARIFYRNAINIGLPVVVADIEADDGDIVSVDLEKGIIVNETKNIEVEFQAFEEFMINILSDGGLVNHFLKEKV